MGQKIIDAHAHPDFGDNYSMQSAKEAGITFSLKGILKDFKKYNILKAVALPKFTHYSRKEKINFTVRNDEIKKLILESKGKFIGGCTVKPTEYTQEDIDVLDVDIKNGIFKAIKLYPGYEHFFPYEEKCTPIYELAQRNNIPVLFHTGDTWSEAGGAKLKYAHPLNIDEVAVSFPDVNFVLCHLGNPWIIDAMEVLFKNNNAYADLSGFLVGKIDKTYKKYYDGRIRAIMEGIHFDYLRLVEKLMFGTDYPLANYASYIKFIRMLDLTNKDFNKIFFENAVKVFNIKL
jgi:hypothetical protein